jgi:glycosyltransferase
VYDSIGMYYPNFKIASDYEFMLRMLKVHNYKSFFLDKVIVKMRVGGVSTSGIKSYIQSTKELRKVWEMNGYRYPLRLYFIRPLKKIRQLLLR